ncbi:hypothetical protein L596_001110 [Steinernema carpocapsae]|uniref:Uncharacterized protein n=1 Tax=Steinernema carpocapsae TaxID=34508 RepID=A0A4U8UMN9_STECR|nr:hypothetical protein L596_001110 [Steinernema carpocapsae]
MSGSFPSISERTPTSNSLACVTFSYDQIDLRSAGLLFPAKLAETSSFHSNKHVNVIVRLLLKWQICHTLGNFIPAYLCSGKVALIVFALKPYFP